jgi:hypothetical protein
MRGQNYGPCVSLPTHHQYSTELVFVRLEVFTAVTMQNGVFWDVTPCSSCKNDVSEELSDSVRVTRNTKLDWYFFAACVGCQFQRVLFLLTDFCHPDEGGAKFHRNVVSYKSHTA